MFPLIYLLIAAILAGGCAAPKKAVISEAVGSFPVISGFVSNASVFQKGGTLLAGAFKAGIGAAANEETDRLSWMILKGFKDALPGENTRLELTDNRNPDFYMDGFIQDYGRDPRFSRRKIPRHQIHLSVEGTLWFREEGEKVLSFRTAVVIDLKKQDPKDVAYQIGASIARYIGTQGAKEGKL